MKNKNDILREYEAKGYHYLGNVMTSSKAYNAYMKAIQNGQRPESVQIGRNLELLLLHDSREIVEVDSGD